MNDIFYFNEEWKPIQDYEELYEVSNYGRVRSLVDTHRNIRKEPKILKTGKNGKGYLHVTLWKKGKSKTFKLHRLVTNAFIPNPQNLPQINHKDEDKTNNHVENLEWCTASYNNSYGTRIERVAEKCSKPVISTDKNGVEEYFPSVAEAERRYGFNHQNICHCCNGKRKTHKGRRWRYADEKGEVD